MTGYVCCCSLAGTKACEHCHNNPNATFNYNDDRIIITTTTSNFPLKVLSKSQKPKIQYWCPTCEALVEKFDKYCHECAQELDWLDFEEKNDK